jgi:hypothetical protein
VPTDGGLTCVGKPNDPSLETYPNGVGASLNLARGPSGLVIVAHDRVHGDLVGLTESAAGWQKLVLDHGGKPGTASSFGLGASVWVSGDAWHVAYGDEAHGKVRYLEVRGTKATPPEIVDDGSAIDGASTKDNGRWIGDDTAITVDDATGVVRIYYQDATAGVLRVAVGTPKDTSGHLWSRSALTQAGRFAGFFPRPIPGKRRVANFWRSTQPGDPSRNGDVSVLDVP